MAKKMKKSKRVRAYGVSVMPFQSTGSKDIVNQAMVGATSTGLSGLMGDSEYNMFGKKQKRK